MKVGLFVPLVNPAADPAYLRVLGEHAEGLGFDSLWVAEHVVLFDEYNSAYPYSADGKIPAGGEMGILEPFTALAFLASVTSRLRLGTGVALVPQRNPVYTAKEVAALDWLSQGRFDFGVGVGWLAEEFEALAVPFEERGARCRDYLEAMKSLWCDAVSSHDGPYYRLPACRQYPKPVQKPHPPIHFGGESRPALARTADLGQGWYGYNLEPRQARATISDLAMMLARRGRRLEEIEVSVCPYLRSVDYELAAAYREARVDQLILFVAAAGIDDLRSRLDSAARSVLEPARGL